MKHLLIPPEQLTDRIPARTRSRRIDSVKTYGPKTKSVADDGNATAAHGGRGEHRIQQQIFRQRIQNSGGAGRFPSTKSVPYASLRSNRKRSNSWDRLSMEMVMEDRKIHYFRRTRQVTWILAILCVLGAAGTQNASASAESLHDFGYVMAGILFVWGLDSHVRIRKSA